jgi:hypothetical protein
VSIAGVFAIARTIVSVRTSFLLRPPIVALVVLFLELAFREQPVVQVAAMNSATLDVNLKCSLTDLMPAMARFCGFPLGRLTEECFSGCSRYSYPDFAISYFLLRKISQFLSVEADLELGSCKSVIDRALRESRYPAR